MGWSGGTFTRVHDWTDDAGAGLNIEASRMDAEDDNFASGINACRHLGGTNSPTANFPMAGYHHTTVGQATARTDYARFDQIQDGDAQWGGTAGGTANALTLSLSPAITAYATGMVVYFLASATNTGTATVNINSVGAKDIFYAGTDLAGYEIINGQTYCIVYDGTQFHLASASNQLGCVAKQSVNQNISAATLTDVEFDTEEVDYGPMHSTGSNPERFNILRTGIYMATCYVNPIDNTSNDRRLLAIYKNTTEFYTASMSGYDALLNVFMNVSGLVYAAEGDYIKFVFANVDNADEITFCRAGVQLMSY